MAIVPVQFENETDLDDEEQDTAEQQGLDSVSKLALMFIPSPDGSVFVPKPNIADMFDNDLLLKVGRCVIDGYQADSDSMTDWSELVDFGLELVKQETNSKSTPWEGAANFKSPELMSAALKFSDRASSELLRSYNILKTRIIGEDLNDQKAEQGQRVSEFQNWQLNVEMPEWRDEHEKLIYDLPYVGTVFKKTFFDAQLGRNTSKLITYPNFAVNQSADSMMRLRRFSEIHDFSANEIIEKERQGIWIETNIDVGVSENDGEESESDKITTFIEQQGFYDLDGDGYEEPYTFVVQESNGVVVRIIPRFEPQDVLIKDEVNRQVFTLLDVMAGRASGMGMEVIRIAPDNSVTKYGFMRDPQGGFLDVGYVHLLSAMVSGVNTTTNQLIDAGTLANRQGGWLSKEFRRKMGDSSFKPGQWKQTGVSAIDLQNGVKPLPIKEPSQTLFALMRFMIANIQNLAASTDIKGTLGANSPVGTTLALIDEQLQGTGAIVRRIYRSMSEEFKKLYVLNSKFVDPLQYQQVLDNNEADFNKDFNVSSMDIVPVANPEISTKTQRIIQAQAEIAQLQAVMAVGGNGRAVVKNFFDVIGSSITDNTFPDETPDQQLQRLLSENPQLQDAVMGEQQRLDLIAAAQADAIERQLRMEEVKTASELDKDQASIAYDRAKAVKTLEEAESESLENEISTYTGAIQIDQQLSSQGMTNDNQARPQ